MTPVLKIVYYLSISLSIHNIDPPEGEIFVIQQH